mmetsp:Transcript_27273/g.30366  ORF Transcript_27273/g.30366 Transcript_27273/m.30366 type:complete len:308 (-) Transcript_27273:107-1030(-)
MNTTYNHGNSPFRCANTGQSLIKPKNQNKFEKSPKMLLELPSKIQTAICALDFEVFSKYNCISRTAAIRTHYDDNLKKHGAWTQYEESEFEGNLKVTCTYQNGKLHGPYRSYHVVNGKEAEIAHYRNGELHGVVKGYNEDGTRDKLENYKDGARHGVQKQWIDDYLCSSHEYKNDKLDGLYEDFFDDGHLDILGNFKNGEKHGERKIWYINAFGTDYHQIEAHSNWKNGKMHGRCRDWYPNGQIHVDSTMCEGEIDGIYKEWSADGTLTHHAKFACGKKVEVYKDLQVPYEDPRHTMTKLWNKKIFG